MNASFCENVWLMCNLLTVHVYAHSQWISSSRDSDWEQYDYRANDTSEP